MGCDCRIETRVVWSDWIRVMTGVHGAEVYINKMLQGGV